MENQYQVPPVSQGEPVTSIGDWIITLILIAIPVVGLVMLCIWAFGGNTPPSKANFAKATLIFAVIGIVFSLLFGSLILGAIASLAM